MMIKGSLLLSAPIVDHVARQAVSSLHDTDKSTMAPF